MNHLTDAQFADLLAGCGDTVAQAHVNVCAACAAEFADVRCAVTTYREATRSIQAPKLRPGQVARPWWQVALTPVAAVLAIAALLVALAPPAPERPAPATVTADPDEALLLEIQNDLYSEVPQALVPAAALNFERNRMAVTAVR